MTVGGVAATERRRHRPHDDHGDDARAVRRDPSTTSPSRTRAGPSGTLRNGWIADFLRRPGRPAVRRSTSPPRRQRDHRRLSAAATTARRDQAPADGRLPAEGQARRSATRRRRARASSPTSPAPSNFAPWIEAMAAEGITGGCGGGNFCPANPVRRDQMAVFLLKAKHGSASCRPRAPAFSPTSPARRPSPTGSSSSRPRTSPAAAAAATTAPRNNTRGPDGHVPGVNVHSSNSGEGPASAVSAPKVSATPWPAPSVACRGRGSTSPGCCFKRSDAELRSWRLRRRGGCGGTSCCPSANNTRGQMAIIHDQDVSPPISRG